MPDRDQSDEEIIAAEHHNFKRSLFVGLATGLGFGVILTGAAILADRMGVLQPFVEALRARGLSPFWLGVLADLTIVLLVVLAGSRYRTSKEAMSERILRKEIDEQHRRQRWLYWLLPFIAFEFAASQTFTRHHSLYDHAIYAVTFLLGAVLACFGPGLLRRTYYSVLNDELTRALRARAIRAGYLTVMAALAATYLATAWRPALALVLVPWVLAIGVAIPMLYFLILDWRTEQDND